MKFTTSKPHRGFTLIETVIAIGVLAVLLTAFMLVFTPAAEGIKKSISVQTADRMASFLENELTTLRTSEASTTTVVIAFDKAFKLIEDTMTATPQVMFVYQYRGDLKFSGTPRADGTMMPYTAKGGKAGEDYIVVTMARRRTPLAGATVNFLQADLTALEGRLYAVIMKQLVFNPTTGQLVENPTAKIANLYPPTWPPPATASSPAGFANNYPDAVIAFSANFYTLPSSSWEYIKFPGGKFDSSKLKNPIFTRNLAVRR